MKDGPANSKSNRVVLIVEDVDYMSKPGVIHLGDVFFTEDEMTYIAYSSYESDKASNDMERVGFGFRWQPRHWASVAAKKQRTCQWGTDVNERLRRGELAIKLPRHEIRSCNAGSQFIVESTKGERFEFHFRDISKYAKDLSGWIDGSLTHNQEYSFLSSKHIPPIFVIETLLAGDKGRISKDELGALAADNEYMNSFWKVVSSMGLTTEPEALDKLCRIEGLFRDRVIAFRKSLERRWLTLGVAPLLLAGLLSIILVVIFRTNPGGNSLSMLLLSLLFLPTIYLFIFGVGYLIKGEKCRQKLLDYLPF